jgi:hypothetical protein
LRLMRSARAFRSTASRRSLGKCTLVAMTMFTNLVAPGGCRKPNRPAKTVGMRLCSPPGTAK